MQREDIAKAGLASDQNRDRFAPLPGLLPAAGIALLAGLGMWAALSRGLAPTSSATNNIGPFEIASVGDAELAGALGSMTGGNMDVSGLAAKRGGCPPHLAWISYALAPHQPRTTIRVESGRYASNVLPVTDIPQRVAIPFPAPYETGRGTLRLRKAGGAIVVALLPAWHVSASETEATQEVSWQPTSGCGNGNGAP
jgi:hypothetical protein